MSDIAIRVENLGKQYRIGRSEGKAGYKTLREAISSAAAAPLHWFGKNRRLRPEETIWALKDVSFAVKKGEVVGVIGRNGAGKSTLLKILSRITEPTTGSVDIFGRVGSLLEVGTGFHPELTGRENIFLNGAILGMKRNEIERRFDEMVNFAEIEKFIDTPVKHYSSGMYLRLAFAVASHLEPDILLVDEVLAVGDAEFQKKCLGKMGAIASEGRTVLFVSHNMGAIGQFCRQCLLLQGGDLERFSDTSEVVKQYLTSGHHTNMQVELDSSRNAESAYLLTSAKVIKEDGSSIGDVSVTEGLSIVLDIVTRRIVSGTDLTVRINNQQGIPVFSASLSQGCELTKAFKIGPNRFSFRIPAQFLSPGTYTISVGIHQPFIEVFDKLDDLLVFEISETGSTRWAFKGKSYGIVLVDFPWSIEPT